MAAERGAASTPPAASTIALRQVERHEQAHARAAEPLLAASLQRRRLAAQQPPQQVQRDRGRAVADVGARAGQVDRARDALLVAVERPPSRRSRRARPAFRACRRPGRRCRSARSPCRPRSARARRRRAPRRPRPRPRRAARSAPPARRAAPSWPRSSTRRPRRRSTPTSRGGRSGAPPAGRRCTTPPPPTRRPCSSAATCSSIELPSVEKTASPWRATIISTSALRRRVAVPRRSGSRSRARRAAGRW